MSGSNRDLEQRLGKALSHPVRVQILHILGEQAASPNEMAKLVQEPLGTVSYHTKVLLEVDYIELVDTKQRRGATEHFYRAKPHAFYSSRNWHEVPESLRRDLTAASLDQFIARAIAALEAGTFQAREGSAFTWQPYTVDERGWKEIQRILKHGEKRIRQVEEKCAKRIEDPGQGIPIVVAISTFEAKGSKDQPSP